MRLTIITRDNISWWRRRREVPRESAVDGAARREEPEIAMVVLDAATGDVVGYAPIRDRSSIYSDNGYLSVQGFLDAETLLLLVGPMDYRTMEPGEEQWHLVAWQFRSGDFELISTGDTGMRTIEVVPDLL